MMLLEAAAAAVQQSSQAMVVGINADVLLAIIGFLLCTVSGWIVLELRDHKAKTEQALADKVSQKELGATKEIILQRIELILESNQKQMSGQKEFFEWERERRAKSRYPDPNNDKEGK